MTILTDFQAKFPEFVNDFDTNLFNDILTYYQFLYGAEYKETATSNNRDNVIILYLIAHLYYSETTGNKSDTKRDVASKSVGSVSLSYLAKDDNTPQSEFLITSKYGQYFLMLTQSRVGTMQL